MNRIFWIVIILIMTGGLAGCWFGDSPITGISATPTLAPENLPTPLPQLDPLLIPSADILDSYQLQAVQKIQNADASYQGTRILTTTLSVSDADEAQWLRFESNMTVDSTPVDDFYYLGQDVYAHASFGWMLMHMDWVEYVVGYVPTPDEVRTIFGDYFQWVNVARYDGIEAIDGLWVYRYIFDQSAINQGALPDKMFLDSTGGSFWVSAMDGYLVRAELTLNGQNLRLSSQQNNVDVEHGTVTLTQAYRQVNQPIMIQVPAEVLQITKPPQDIPVYENMTPLIGGPMDGTPFFFYETNDDPENVAAFYKQSMEQSGWHLATTTEGPPRYTYIYTLRIDETLRTVVIDISTNTDNGKTNVAISSVTS